MKNVASFENGIDPKYQKIVDYDKAEIDNPDTYSPSRMLYVDRISRVILWINKKFPQHENVTVGEIGSAQANMSLTLAEQGFKAIAVDIDQKFLDYGKMKYEKGDITWVCANIETLNIPRESLDVAIMGEIIEHCAYPEDVISKTLEFVKPGGYVVITTPNGSRLKTGLPTFGEFAKKEDRKKFEELQFGPDGNNHLFLFTLNEVDSLIPKNATVVSREYVGSTILLNRRTKWVFRIFPRKAFESFIRLLSKVPFLNKKTFNNIMVVIKKTA